jgi:nicotinamide-nucleotide amidase
MNAEILAFGDEITSGQLLDTNTQWLSQRLEELGIRVLYHSTVGDELTPSADAFRRAVDRADVVISTGGIGPTADDLTRDALAEATGRKLARNAEAMEHIRNLFARRKRPMPPQNELQAMFPDGSRVIHNPHGTAPGIAMDVPREGRPPCHVFVFPGVPAEMVEMWAESVGEAVRALPERNRVILRRRIHCFGAGESQLESMLPDLIRRGRQPTVGITASKATITLRIAAEGTDEAECQAAIDRTVATIRDCLGSLVFGEEDDDLQHVVLRRLRERDQTLATAEWATAGMAAEWLGGVDGAPGVYRGGLVIAEETACRTLLGLPSNLPEVAGGTDEFVRAMAIGCRRQFDADFGLAIGPFPPSGERASTTEQPADTSEHADAPKYVLVALATKNDVRTLPVSVGLHPALLRIYCVKHALNLLRLDLY